MMYCLPSGRVVSRANGLNNVRELAQSIPRTDRQRILGLITFKDNGRGFICLCPSLEDRIFKLGQCPLFYLNALTTASKFTFSDRS